MTYFSYQGKAKTWNLSFILITYIQPALKKTFENDLCPVIKKKKERKGGSKEEKKGRKGERREERQEGRKEGKKDIF